VGLLVIGMTLLVNAGLTVSNLLPVEASTQAVSVDRLFSIHFMLMSFLFSLITVFIGYSIVVFRAKPGDTQSGKFFKSNNRLELIWMVVPLITVMLLAFVGSQTLADTLRSDPQAMQIKVLAYQWGWTFEYPDTGITTNQLYLPVGKQVLFSMTSRDVIHAFWVPEWRIKQDILPGANLVKTLRITPSEIGNFKVRCAEMCGGSHAYMEAPVNVVSQADYDAWVSQQMAAVSANPEDRGKTVSQTLGCLSCHSVDGKKSIGPTWKGLAGSTVEFTDGTTAVADDAYLKQYIVNPDFKVIKGFPANVMPKTFGKTLTDQQISDIIAYIKTLK
jgi:cytochrome c oxidase subunit 2